MNLLIRADANHKIGNGHIMRCMALGQAWKGRGGSVIFLSNCDSSSLRKRIIDEGFEFAPIEQTCPKPSDIELVLEKLYRIGRQESNDTWLVLDGYQFSSGYQYAIKEAGHRLLVVDDTAHLDYYYADIILNQNIKAKDLKYPCLSKTRLLLGNRYVLLRSEFMEWRAWKRQIPDKARHVLVTFGGSDPHNVTMQIINALKQVDMSGIEVTIVVGAFNLSKDSLKAAVSDKSVTMNILDDAKNMADLMAWADLAVSSGGSTCWEMAFMKLPFFTVVLADNQIDISDGVAQAGIAINCGWYNEMDKVSFAKRFDHLIKHRKYRSRMSAKAGKLIDGAGANRIVDAMLMKP
jgi:UDP-2,4-diacetamido-2,4,6-trideoxy-beta-L-altropyranose hydrolase